MPTHIESVLRADGAVTPSLYSIKGRLYYIELVYINIIYNCIDRVSDKLFEKNSNIHGQLGNIPPILHTVQVH